MKIYEQLHVLLSEQIKDTFTTSELKTLMHQRYGINKDSVIPSDYCYNRINNGIEFDKHLLLYVKRGVYKYVGLNYKYTGKVYHKEKGHEEIAVGEWEFGVFSRYETTM